MNLNPIIKLPVAELKTAIGGLTKVISRHNTLPVLGMIHVERDRHGWVRLTSTDLDTFLTFRLEAPGEVANSTSCRISLGELQKLAKTCPADEVLELEVLGEDRLLLRHHIGSHAVEQVVASVPLADFPQPPQLDCPPASLDEATRTNLLNALECASDDETRVILNGAYLDVSKPESHYIVATNGRHLFATNSIPLPLAKSLIIPDHRFVTWGRFIKDGQWKLAVKEGKKGEPSFLKLESRRWTFTTKQIEGNYPNWRQVVPDASGYVATIELGDGAADEIQRIVPRLPGGSLENRTVGLCVYGSKLFLRGWNQGDDRGTEVEVPGVMVKGKPENVYINRDYLTKAVGFGLRHIALGEPLRPLRFHDNGSRQMIIMPVRIGADPQPGASQSPACADTAAAPTGIATARAEASTHHNHNQPEERTQPAMQNPNSDEQTSPTAATSPTGEKPALEQALDQIEAIKGSMRGAVTSLNGLADSLRQIHRERRLNEREIRSVRDTLKTLQTVRL